MSARRSCPHCGADLDAAFAEVRKAEGATFRARRELRELSLRETARRAGISAAFLSDIELGRRSPSRKVRTAILSATRAGGGR